MLIAKQRNIHQASEDVQKIRTLSSVKDFYRFLVSLSLLRVMFRLGLGFVVRDLSRTGA